MQEAAVELLDAAIVSYPPYRRRRTRPVRMAAKADDATNMIVRVRSVVRVKPTFECPRERTVEWP